MASPNYVILDADPGTDDAWAIAMILKAEKTHNVKLLAITTCTGNATIDNVVRNAARVLGTFNRTDVKRDNNSMQIKFTKSNLETDTDFQRSE